ncbi:High affinity cAMP-specific and IBMX-insensitive 3',5'-cyclic phosphodiesterase 9A [Irineochytrium annulatum]|nr:High affinity cAMP-specific and IBMX-insensitive 3',5'-cyclic phosphodiesterase 9A [Irineochytrium annulatum]
MSHLIHVTVNDSHEEIVRISRSHTLGEVRSVFLAAANVCEDVASPSTEGGREAGGAGTTVPRSSGVVLKLYSRDNVLIPIGPHVPPNSPSSRYRLVVKTGPSYANYTTRSEPEIERLVRTLKATNAVLGDLPGLKRNMSAIRHRIETDPSSQIPNYTQNDPVSKPAMNRVSRIPMDEIKRHAEATQGQNRSKFSTEVYEALKHPTFDIWQWDDGELVALLEHMFVDLGMVETFGVDRLVLSRFLHCVRITYNNNPFHNFRHCFCVAQMMYGIIHVTGVHAKLTALEKLTLLVATIGHDLDHTGCNNAYQVNAYTELAIVYNDISPLENHHSAVLFTLLKDPELNVLAGLTDVQFREVRKNVITCILATDMAKHGEIIAKFKSHADNFNFDDPAQRQLLLQIITKCSDISNEVRPKHVSEPWVDNLLNEFFNQSDREKAEGLPTAPFMDREKVTKPSAQVGFIGFVMIPLYELVSKVLPNMDGPVIQPIRKAHEYYKAMLDNGASK